MNEKECCFINGKFLCQKVTGVQRFAIEIVKAMDQCSTANNFILKIIAPSEQYCVTHLKLENIEIIYTKGKPNYLWEQFSLPKYCKKNKAQLLSLCNLAPIFYPGFCVIHDLAIIDAPRGLGKSFRFFYKLVNKLNIKRYKEIFTVSETMRLRIMDYYEVDNVKVVYNGCEHISNVNSMQIDELVPYSGKFYFSVGSMNPNKNFKSIVEIAKKHPNILFVVSGGNFKSFNNQKEDNIPSNMRFLGYVSDEELSWLYKNCKAFVFPTKYEGFGIPPIEALILGCKNVFCNDITVLREIYGDNVRYYDADKDDFTLLESVEYIDITGLKEKLSWKKSAEKILKVLM